MINTILGDIIPIKTEDAVKILVDSRNKELWELVKSKYNISFMKWNQNAFGGNIQGNNVIFLIPKSNYNKGLFTHELLHLKIRIYGVKTDELLNTFLNAVIPLRNIINESNFIFTHNFLDHILFYDEFIRLGYDEKDFVSDYNDDKFNDLIEDYLCDNFNNKEQYNSTAIGFYISKYIGLRASRNKSEDFTEAYNIMEKLDSDLFSICKKFVDSYIDESILGYEYMGIFQANVISYFINDLFQWTLDRNIS